MTRVLGMDAIQDHAIIGDGRSAALISRAGSVEWLCWPRIDSPPFFGAILDDRAGRWRIAPTEPFRSERSYLEHTNVLCTCFATDRGRLRIIDLMPVAAEEEKRRILVPEHEILRVVECEEGAVDIDILFEPRLDFGRRSIRLRSEHALGIRIDSPRGLFLLRSEMPLEIERDRAIGRAVLRKGDVLHFSLTFTDEGPAIAPPLGAWSRESIERSVRCWRTWVQQLRYEGPAYESVVRSALTLKLLIYAPSGAVVAAPTTSLPERIGGDLNWDYRFCWVRDAAFTVRALLGLGFAEEAAAFVSWLLHSTRLTQPAIRVLYDVYGRKPAPEREVPDLGGHLGSRPVRLGNQAMEQRQLDVYGEVIDAVARSIEADGSLDRSTERMLCSLGRFVSLNWTRADEGIWETRAARRHHTHSRVLCWVALDRLLRLHERGYLPRAPAAELRDQRERIRREVEARAWNAELDSYVATLDGDEVDASLLLLSWYGFEPAASARMRKTHKRIRERLGAKDGLLYRNAEFDEGAFGVCGFWSVEQLAREGRLSAAEDLFLHLCRHANDIGLFGEQIDPATGAALGNFPQAFTHVGLISAALTLAECRAERPAEIERHEAGEVRA